MIIEFSYGAALVLSTASDKWGVLGEVQTVRWLAKMGRKFDECILYQRLILRKFR
jgi:hypothetical protein